MLDGRVKTLHPTIHGGLLARRDRARAHGGARRARHRARSTCWWSTSTRSRPPSRSAGCTLDDAIENIDIGGPAMVRSAAKNWNDVAVLTDAVAVRRRARRAEARPAASRRATQASRSRSRRSTASRNYDAAISDYLSSLAGPSDGVPERARFPAQAQRPLRQAAGPALRREPAPARRLLPRPRSRRPARSSRARQLQGKELSYNNIADADAAWECVKSFDDARACVIVKHANPCGVAIGARRGRGLREGASRPTRPRPSAASSPSTRGRSAPRAEARRQAVRRGADRAGVSAPRRSRVFAAKANVRVLADRAARRPATAAQHARPQAGRLGPADPERRQPRAGSAPTSRS